MLKTNDPPLCRERFPLSSMITSLKKRSRVVKVTNYQVAE